MIEKEIKIILDKFLNNFEDYILLKKLSDFLEINGFGTECYGCMTSEGLKPGDEDFFAYDCVKITISPPASINEVMIIVTNQVFYNALENRIKSYIINNPQNMDNALEYLNIIKSKLIKQN